MEKKIFYEISEFIKNKAINDKLCSLIVENLNYDMKSISYNTCLNKDIGADSLDIIELMIDVEDKIINLDKQIPDDDIVFLWNVGVLNVYIESFMKQNQYSTKDIIYYAEKRIKIEGC